MRVSSEKVCLPVSEKVCLPASEKVCLLGSLSDGSSIKRCLLAALDAGLLPGLMLDARRLGVYRSAMLAVRRAAGRPDALLVRIDRSRCIGSDWVL